MSTDLNWLPMLRVSAWIVLGSCMLILTGRAAEKSAPDALEAEFASPPASARPRVWWHWMNGNVTQEGIQLDLEWMRRIGLGGVQNFDAAFATPEIVHPHLTYMTPAWQDAFRFAIQTADRLGLEVSIAGSPGWSESGGPWVKPAQAMKKLVWSETRVTGGRRFTGKVLQPPTTVGPFQNVPLRADPIFGGHNTPAPTPLYADVAVLAYRLPNLERAMSDLQPVITSSDGVPIGRTKLWDGDLDSAIGIACAAGDEGAWVQFAFDRPQVIRAMSIAMRTGRGSMFRVDPTRVVARLQARSDGSRFSTVIDVMQSIDFQQTLSFPPVTARYFRVLLPNTARQAEAGDCGPGTQHLIDELVFYTDAHVNHAEEKAGFFVAPDPDAGPTPPAPADAVIQPGDVVDLTSMLRPDGSLDWTPPQGRWVVLRLGYSLLGTTNHPASPEGTGLEVDKLSRQDVQSYVTQYLEQYTAFLPARLVGQRGLHGMVNDSWEAGAQNWTEDMPEEFVRRRGYSLRPWMPALLGRVIGSSGETERFLWDYRRTLGELVAENHYGMIAEELHGKGMIHYSESHEVSRAFIGDGMDVKRFSDIPMSAMWSSGLPQEPADADIRESASVAHLYGQNLVAAESFTARGNAFAFTPQSLKPAADRELADGVNRFVIHTSVHQPLNDPGPGFTLGPFGQWFTRHETWAEQAQPWISYLARSSYLLQQGIFVADVLYFYGEDSNITALYGRQLPAIPEGYSYDFANARALELLSVREGRLITRSGMQYSVLVLDPRARVMSLDVLKRIRDLVSAGAVVIGEKPTGSPSLADDPVSYRDIVNSLWGGSDEAGAHRVVVGKGHVISGIALDDAFSMLGIDADFDYERSGSEAPLTFVHRRLGDGDLYFIRNRFARSVTTQASFRVRGRVPESWDADTGHIESVSYRITGQRTSVPLRLEPLEAIFVVFRKPATQSEVRVAPVRRTLVARLDGPWEVQFAQGQGAPASVRFAELLSWTQRPESGIKYYSGTAVYRRSLNVSKEWLRKSQRIELDLGDVRELAEVLVNGKSVGVLWKRPFRIDVSDWLRTGGNLLEVRVTNTWVNRLIGDKQPGAERHVFTTFDPYEADSPVMEAGLLGPVRIELSSRIGSSAAIR